MNTEEFESLILGAEETQALEFKGPCQWSVKLFAKDILALSNVQDGGFIVIGVEDKSWKRVGMTAAQTNSFQQEVMQDQMTSCSDPFVTFSCYKVKGADKKKYVVIKVHEFPEVPVVSRTDKFDLKEGVIYYRTRRRRPCSEPVANSYDMQDILDRAAVKLMSKRRSQGYRSAEEETNKQLYEKELGGL